MKIESLKIKNFKALKDVEMQDIPNLCVILGANGSGKSTFFRVFRFLKEALNKDVHAALIREGGSKGFDGVKSRGCPGDIEIELKFRMKKTGGDNPLITYSIGIGKDKWGRGVVEKEMLMYRRGSHGRPYTFLNFSKGKGIALTNQKAFLSGKKPPKREKQELKSKDILAVKGLAQFDKFPAVVKLGELIDSWHLSDIHISKAKRERDDGPIDHLSTSGDNLSLVVEYFHKYHPEKMKEIKKALTRRVPGITKVKSMLIPSGRMLLQIQDKAFASPFLLQHVSDGTIKMLAYLILLYDPKPHTLLCVEEPENQLYPTLLFELAEEFRDYARRGGQVFVSTHSPDFLNELEMKEVFFLIKKDGYTTIQPASDDEQIVAYIKAGDKMGNLWTQRFFRGVDP